MPNRRKSPEAPREKPKQFQVHLRADHQKSFPSFYSNYAAISHTSTELCIDFCTLAPPFQVDLEKKITGVPVVVRVLVPPDMADGLVKALQKQIQRYQSDRKNRVIPIGKKADQ